MAESLREQIARAWWEIDTKTPTAKKMIPTPKQHRNLLGNKEKYLDAILPLITKRIKGIENPYACGGYADHFHKQTFDEAIQRVLKEVNDG